MWKAERFEGTEEKDPLEQMLDFVNARNLRPGQFQFTVAADEEGYQHCLMLYTEEAPAPTRAPRAPAEREERPGRFQPGGGGRGERPERGERGERGGRGGGRDFQPRFGPPGGGRGRPRGGGGGRGPRPGGPRGGGGRPRGAGPRGKR
jgi:hypothetical protein